LPRRSPSWPARGRSIITATTAGPQRYRSNGTRTGAELQAALEREKARQAQVVEKVVVEYRDRVKVIKEKGDEIVKAVPYYVRASCALPGGWRVLHDAAASGSFPEDPDGAIAAAEPVEGVAAAETVASNYAACRADQARLAALQQLLAGIAQ
jgi:predicted acylesterase/phospholipase RssA